jgi:hypothetical protein
MAGLSLPAALTARCSSGALCHHVKREASRFIRSMLEAKRRGREEWYSHYMIRICRVEREYGRPDA